MDNNKPQTVLFVIIAILVIVLLALFTLNAYTQEKLNDYKIDGAIAMNSYNLSAKLSQDVNATPEQIQTYQKEFIKTYYSIISGYKNIQIDMKIQEWIILDKRISTEWMDANYDVRQQIYGDYRNKMNEIDALVYNEMLPRYAKN